MRSMRMLAAYCVLSVFVGCSGRATRDTSAMAAAGASGAGSGGTSSTGGSASGGTSSTGGSASGGTSSGGAPNMAGAGGAIPMPSGCIYEPEGPPAQGQLAAPEEVWRRISTFLADEALPAPADLPAETTAAWAGDTALALVDSFVYDEAEPPGLTSFFAAWMPELEDPALWARLAAQESATIGDLLTFSPSVSGGPAFGILTDHGFLTSKTNIGARGAWMQEHLYCAVIPEPPVDFPVPVPTPATTSRQEYEATLGDAVCAGCHVLIDPLGFSLEHFDAMGVYRDVDDGLPVDASGTFTTPDGASLSFTSIEDLAPALPSCAVAQCWSTRLFGAARERAGITLQDEEVTADTNRIVKRMGDDDFGLRTLIRAIVESPSFLQP